MSDADGAAAFAEPLAERADHTVRILLRRDGEVGAQRQDALAERADFRPVGAPDGGKLVAARFFPADVWPLDVDSREIRGVFRLFDSLRRAFDFFKWGGHDRREYGGDAGFRIGKRKRGKLFFVRFHDIDSASAVRMHIDKSRQDISASRVDDGVGEENAARDPFVFKAERAVFKAPLAGVVNIGVFDFGRHFIFSFLRMLQSFFMTIL